MWDFPIIKNKIFTRFLIKPLMKIHDTSDWSLYYMIKKTLVKKTPTAPTALNLAKNSSLRRLRGKASQGSYKREASVSENFLGPPI